MWLSRKIYTNRSCASARCWHVRGCMWVLAKGHFHSDFCWQKDLLFGKRKCSFLPRLLRRYFLDPFYHPAQYKVTLHMTWPSPRKESICRFIYLVEISDDCQNARLNFLKLLWFSFSLFLTIYPLRFSETSSGIFISCSCLKLVLFSSIRLLLFS